MKGFTVIIVLLFFVSCAGNKKNKTSKEKESRYVINRDDVNIEDTIHLSSYFQEVKTIILETTPACLIGAINNIKVLDNYIIVTDRRKTKAVFVFNKSGKFLHRIGSKGSGIGQYADISDACIDNDRKEIYILDSQLDKIHTYQIETGEFLHSIKINNQNHTANCINCTNNKLYLSVMPTIDTEDSYLLQEVETHTGKHLSYYLHSTHYNRGWNDLLSRNDSFFYPTANGDATFVGLFMNTVISISNKGVEPYLEFKAKNWITKQDVKELIEYKEKHKGAISTDLLFEKKLSYNIHRFFEDQNTIYFQYQNHGEIEYVFFDKRSKTSRVANTLVDNLVYSIGRAMNTPFAYADQNGVYSYLVGNHIPPFLACLQSNEVTFDLDKRDSLKWLLEDSNPVIFYYEFKK